MATITKTTAAGTATITVDYRGCDVITATMNGKEIGRGMIRVTPRTINGNVIVAAIGRLGVTAAEVEQIEAALVIERNTWMQTDAGREAAEYIARSDRVARRNEEIARKAEEWERAE